MPMQHGEQVGIDDERLAVVFSPDVENDSRHKQQQSGDDKHDRADERGKSRNHTGMPEVHGHAAA